MRNNRLKSLITTGTLGLVFSSLVMVFGQTPPPSTDIYLVSLAHQGNQWKVGAPENVTHRAGYDNQPFFSPDGKSALYTSAGADGQTDIYRYDLARKSAVRLTNTPESEYSPTITPDGKFFSVIRVEADKTQRLWKFPLDGGAPEVVLKGIKPVGYHAWIDSGTVVVFVLGSPSALQVVRIPSEEAKTVAENVGRSVHLIPERRAISFVKQDGNGGGTIEEWDVNSSKIATLIPTAPKNEFHSWSPFPRADRNSWFGSRVRIRNGLKSRTSRPPG